MIDLMVKIRKALGQKERDALIDEALRAYGKVLDENSALRAEMHRLQKSLLDMAERQ